MADIGIAVIDNGCKAQPPLNIPLKAFILSQDCERFATFAISKTIRICMDAVGHSTRVNMDQYSAVCPRSLRPSGLRHY